MIGFEKYLIEQGFQVKRRVYKNKEWVFVDGYSTPSTMENLDNYYFKNDTIICIGLNEKDKPITLINPKPKGVYYDDEMNRILQNTPFDEILKMITQ